MRSDFEKCVRQVLTLFSMKLLITCGIIVTANFAQQVQSIGMGIPHQRESIFDRMKTQKCQPLNIPLCRDIPYNKTIYPNPFIEADEYSLKEQSDHFKPLIRTKCNAHILFFICSVFAPMCPEQIPQPITSCRSICEEVKRDCIKIFHDFDIQWPAYLNCSRFPEAPELCMKPSDEPPAPKSLPNSLEEIPNPTGIPQCPQDLVNLDPTDPNGLCAFRCDKTTMFKKDKKEQARLWILMWAILNMVITSFTVISFWIDRKRFYFPERSVCFIAVCYLFFSIPFLARVFMSFENTTCAQLPSTGAKFLIQNGHRGNTFCVVSFVFNHYFLLAGYMWWLMLTFTWYLSAARKWAEEEIEKRSVYLHLFAWGVPAFFSVPVLAFHKVDASELWGLCSTGNLDPWTLLGFVLVPRIVIISTGICFIIAGFTSMCRERKCFRSRGTDTSKLEKFMFKMGSFSMLYALPTIIAVICDFHHLFVLFQWYPTTVACKLSGGSYAGECTRAQQPQVEIYILGATMCLSAGLATGLWIFSPKTLNSWKRVIFWCCYGRNTNPRQLPTSPKSNSQQQQNYLTAGTASSMLTTHAHLNGNEGSGTNSNNYAGTTYHRHQSTPSYGANNALYDQQLCQPLLLPRDPPPQLPPPPPTAVPSLTYYNFQSQNHSGGGHYIPLSVMTSNNDASVGRAFCNKPQGAMEQRNNWQQSSDII